MSTASCTAPFLDEVSIVHSDRSLTDDELATIAAHIAKYVRFNLYYHLSPTVLRWQLKI
jgi:hypothetical protein